MFFKLKWFLPLLLFFTSCGLFQNPLSIESPEWNFSVFAQTFSEHYSLFEQKGIDWKAVTNLYRANVTSSTADTELYGILTAMIDPLDDGHVWLNAGSLGFFSTNNEVTADFWSFESKAESYISSAVNGDIFNWGRLKDAPGIGYINIDAMTSGLGGGQSLEPWVRDLDEVIDSLLDCEAVIIDIRHNGGGYAANAEHIAGRFTGERHLYMKSRIRNGASETDYTAFKEHWLEPRAPVYPGKVYLITDKFSASAAEWMTLMMRTIPGVEHIGTPTHGAMGMVSFHELPNGWIFSTTIGQTYDSAGISFEGAGIEPAVAITPVQTGDSAIEYVLGLY